MIVLMVVVLMVVVGIVHGGGDNGDPGLFKTGITI